MTLSRTLRSQAESRPNDLAFVANGEEWTYRRLATASEHLARALTTQGVHAGDRVALHMRNIPAMAIAYYACFFIGAIAAPLNIRMKTVELRSLLQRLRPALYLGQDELYPLVADIPPDILAADRRFVAGIDSAEGSARPWADLNSCAATHPIPEYRDTDAPAVLLTTSGTTGQPKFVIHTQATLAAIIGRSRSSDLMASRP